MFGLIEQMPPQDCIPYMVSKDHQCRIKIILNIYKLPFSHPALS